MSLINDMLRDLDDRREGNRFSTDVSANLTAAETEQSFRKSHLLLPAGMVVLAAVIVSGLLPGGKKQSATGLAASAPVASPLPQNVLPTELSANVLIAQNAQSLADLSSTDSTAGPSAESAEHAEMDVADTNAEHIAENALRLQAEELMTVAPEKERGTEDIEQLLHAARDALKKDRLTVPESASALSFYRQVLEAEPKNAEALAGIETISQRYLQLMETAKSGGDPSRLHFLVRRAEASDIPNLPLANYRQQLVLWQQQSSQPAAQAAEIATDQTLPPSVKTGGVAEFGKTSAGEKSPGIEKTLSTRDKQAVERLREEYQHGSYAAAITGLETFIVRNPAADLSRRQLFDWYLEQNRLQEAQALAASANHNPVLQSWFQARILVKQNQPAAARFLLEEKDFNQLQLQWRSGIIDDRLYEDYNSLLAALFQKLGDHLLALEKYQLLVSLNSEQPDYWLGFAMSSDVLGHQARALAAYEQVLRLGPQTATVATYVKSRVETLAASQDTRIAGAGGN